MPASKRRPYPPAVKASKGKRAGTEKFVQLCCKRFGLTNLGTWVVRDMRGKPGVLSCHATGRACDLGYNSAENKARVLTYLTTYNTELGVTLINDYLYGKYGRTWMCDRQAWKVHDKPTLGSSRGAWIHVELDAWAADDPVTLERVWRSLPR